MDIAARLLQNQVRLFASEEGRNPSRVPGVTAWRFTTETIQMPAAEEPYLYLVLDGALRLHTPSGILDYMAGQYSVSRIDTPQSGDVLAFSDQQDFLALSITFTAHDIIDIILRLDNDLVEKIMTEALDPYDMAVSDQFVPMSVSQLFTKLGYPSEFFRKHLLEEIFYQVLCGSCGKAFIQSVADIRQADEIYEANSWIKEHFRQAFTVESLAEQRNMSVSQFHQKFKSAVGMGPLQCRKRLRLTEARRLMLDEQKNVTEASLEVGYESVSQFTRDYKKMFGAAPREDIQNLRRPLEK